MLLWPSARDALASQQAGCELLLVEGAGSPAEINLAASHFVNTAAALASQAACLLVSDIDRGGAFAHLYGTHALTDAQVRRQVRSFVLNRFRGGAALLAPGPQLLQDRTGVPTLAVVPMLRGHGLPEEDAVPADADGTGPRVVVLATPHASNLDEFEPLRAAGVGLRFVRDAAGKPLLVVCGALQWLGQGIDDPLGLEGGQPGRADGLGRLSLQTQFQPVKQLQRASHRLGGLAGPWAPLAGLLVDAYQIHLGSTQAAAALAPNDPLQAAFERLADAVDAAFAPGVLLGLLRPAG